MTENKSQPKENGIDYAKKYGSPTRRNPRSIKALYPPPPKPKIEPEK